MAWASFNVRASRSWLASSLRLLLRATRFHICAYAVLSSASGDSRVMPRGTLKTAASESSTLTRPRFAICAADPMSVSVKNECEDRQAALLSQGAYGKHVTCLCVTEKVYCVSRNRTSMCCISEMRKHKKLHVRGDCFLKSNNWHHEDKSLCFLALRNAAFN